MGHTVVGKPRCRDDRDGREDGGCEGLEVGVVRKQQSQQQSASRRRDDRDAAVQG